MGYGVVLVMTSNRHPDQLYKNGLQRESFIPCIDLIKERLEVVDLTGEGTCKCFLSSMLRFMRGKVQGANLHDSY
jgi:protein AFG1